MQRTYKSKKETTGTIDPRDVLLTLDAKSSVFDAFYIQNIKQTKRDMSVASSMQFAASNKVRKRKNVKRLKEQEALFQPTESTSITAFLTPDKSFRVNKPQDLFDQLLNSSSNKVESLKPLKMCRKPSAFQKKTYIKKKPKKIKIVNYSNSDSTDSEKENFKCIEAANKTANTSDIKSHKLIIEKETKSSPKYDDESINDIVNNLSMFSNIKNQTFTTPKNNNNICSKQAQHIQTSPLCSTPFLHKYRGASIYRFSPISRSLDSSPKCVTVMEDSNDDATDDLPIVHEEKNNMKSYIIDEKQDITEATINENIEHNIVPENKNDCNTFDIINKNNATAASRIYNTMHETSKTEIQSPILSNQVNVNKREPRKLATYLSCMQTTETEPFLGFEHIDLVENDELDAVHNKYMELKNVLVENSYSIPTCTKISRDSTFVNINLNTEKDQKAASLEIEASSGVENSDSESFYDACNSDDDNQEQVQNIEPVVVVERLNDSILERYYSQMANYSVEGNNLNTSSDSYDYASDRASALILANKSSNSSTKSRISSTKSRISSSKSINSSPKSRNSSFTSRNSDESTDFDILVGDVENNGNIISNQIDDNYNSIESQSEDICVSFVTTRRRNEFRNDSFIGLNNSIVSACSHEFDKTVLTNKNSLEYSNYVTLEENIVDNVDDTLNIKEEMEQNETAYKCYTSESDEISEAEHSPKVKKILTRKSVRESIKVNKSKSPIYNADSSLNIEAEEIEQMRTEFNHSISRSDEINEAKHSPKFSEDKKSKLPLTNADNTLNKVTRSSNIYRDSIAGKSQNTAGYENKMGNESISCEQPGIILEPGKRWERSLSIYRRQTTMADHFNHSILDEEHSKVRKYRQSVITATEMEDLEGSFHNDSINSRRGTFVSKPSRSTIKIVRESNISRASLCSTIVCEDLEGFLGEDCDDTIVELSKLSIADSQHEVTIIEKFHDTSNRRTTARDYVLRRCNQADVLPFDECYPDPVLKNCRKIGEGVYGEVFLWRAGDGRARVLKVIPIAGNIKVNGEQQKDFHEIISEIVIAMELSALRAPIADIEQHLNEGKSLETLDLHSVENATDAFNEVLSVRCVCGDYPARLLELWELYDECRGSENDSPAALPRDQHYLVLELDNAGQDLESYRFHDARQAYALLHQIAFGLAVAEEAYQFEHRDLHWGNVLISPTEEKYASFVVRGRLHRVCRGGVRASIIDYSLSRATLGRWSLYNDLANDDALFDALGDYQFQLYRLMRDKLGNDWKNFEPYTNILWLHYTVDKMITALRYTRTNTKIHKHYIAKLKEIKNGILDYGSAVQYVLTDNEL